MNKGCITARDVRCLSVQMTGRRFDPSTVLTVAHRCCWGFPQVILCRPFKGGKPFPTLFWLTCPWLNKQLGVLESLGGVSCLEEELRHKPKSWRNYMAFYARIRRSLCSKGERLYYAKVYPRLWKSVATGGVGGIQSLTPTVKCLHLQTGTWLGMGHHPAAGWLRRKIGDLNCPNQICKSLLQKSENQV